MKDETDLDSKSKKDAITHSVLDAFHLLKSPKDDIKLTGGSKIISQLRGNESEREIQYTLKRLVRCLGANVSETRTGYFATLVALLSRFNQINVNLILEVVKKELHPNGSSKSEVGNVALGQILVCGAVFRSGLILTCTNEEQAEIMQLLLTASKKKSYLSTVTYLILLDFASGLSEDQFSTIIWVHFKQELNKTIMEHTLDSLYFLMIAAKKFPNKVKFRKLLGVPELLCEDNIHTISEKLLAGVDFNSIGHPIYKEVGIQIANSPNLKLFWISGIDSQLVKHNRNRELVAVNILTTILTNIQVNVEVIPDLISQNFFKLVMDWFKGLQTASKIRTKRDNEDDNKLMIKKQKEVLNALAKALKCEKVNSHIRVEVLKKLLFNPGEMNFTDITGTTIIKSIIADLDEDGVAKMAKLFKGVLLNTTKKHIKDGVERNWYNNERLKAAEMISYLVSHEAMKEDTEFKLTYMKLLMCFGFFKIGGNDNVAVSSDFSGAIKTCFYRCFTSRFSNVDSLVTVLSSLCSFICSILEKDNVRTKVEKQFPQENMECWELLIGVCQNIQKRESKSKVDKVFLILLYQLGLFLFSEPTHVKIARSSIKELKSCYEHYKKIEKTKTKKIVIENGLLEEPEWIEVIVEVLLSILSAESSVLRSVVQCVFRLLWEYLTPSSIGQIVSVLDPDSESNPLSRDSDSEEESDSEEKKEEGDQSDKDSNNSYEESDSEVENDEDDDDDVKIPDQLRIALQKALGVAAPTSDTESVDADMIDEEEGKKLDEALAEAFKQFHQGKMKKSKKDRKDKKALSDFRIRVVDLIDIYLEKDPSMDVCLAMIAPLTRCLESCIQDSHFSELENRIRKTIKNLTKIKKFSSADGVTIDILCDYMKSIVNKGERSHFMFQALGDVITYFAIFIIHCSQKIIIEKHKSPKKIKSSPFIEILKEAVQSYFQNRNCLLPIIFFHNILQMEWDGNFELIPIIIDNIFNRDVRQFRRSEGVELIAGFYRALKRNKPASDLPLDKLPKLEAKFADTMVSTLKEEKDLSVKKNFFNLLKKLINTIKLFHESCHIDSALDFKKLLEIVDSCKSTSSGNDQNQIQNTNQTQKLSNKTTIQQNKTSKKKKRKAEQVNGHTEPQIKKNRTGSVDSD